MRPRARFFGAFDTGALRAAPPPGASADDRHARVEDGVLHLRGDAGGAKPVFHATDARTGALVFGESATHVLAAAGREARIDPAALREYLATGRLAGDPQTLFTHVQAIPRGSRLEVRGKARSLHADSVVHARPPPGSAQENADQLRALLLEAVGHSLHGARAAIALSGGIDSSGLLGCAAKLRAEGPMQAYCYASQPGELPESLNEIPWATLAADASGARLTRVTVGSDEVPGLVAQAVANHDFPFGSPVILAQGKVFAAIAEAGCDVVLGGHGPEILFGGTSPQAALRAAELAREGRVVAAWRLLAGSAQRLPAPRRDLLRATVGHLAGLHGRSPGPAAIPWASERWFAERVSGGPAGPGAPPDPAAIIDELLTRSAGSTSLMHEDRNAACHGLEVRQPYLSSPVIAFARALPLAQCLSADGDAKQVLRIALRGLVPQAILERRDRLGFAAPAVAWLLAQRPWVESRYRDLRSLPFFAGPSFEEAWASLERGGMPSWTTAFRLWRWVVLLEWATARNARFE